MTIAEVNWYLATSFRAEHPEAYDEIRDAIIEECARVAEEWPRQEMGIAVSIMVAIRALKDKA